MTKDEALRKIATVNAMDYEYQAWAREALANDTSQERVDETAKQRHEPVGEVGQIDIDEDGVGYAWFTIATDGLELGDKLYTTPPQRKPVASLYVAPNGEREFDDFLYDFPIGRYVLYTDRHTHEPITNADIERLCPQFDDPMRREMWIIGFKAAHGIKGEA